MKVKWLVGNKNNSYLSLNYKPSTYLIITYFITYLPIYMRLMSYKIGYQGQTKYYLVGVHSKLVHM
jgi:hypothetical protein